MLVSYRVHANKIFEFIIYIRIRKITLENCEHLSCLKYAKSFQLFPMGCAIVYDPVYRKCIQIQTINNI